VHGTLQALKEQKMDIKGKDLTEVEVDLSVKKRRARRTQRAYYYGTWEPVRRTIVAMNKFYGGLAKANAEAFRAFNDELENGDDLTCDIIDGLAEGNARFYENMAATSRSVVDEFREDEEALARTLSEGIDYNRLARLVALELRKLEQEEAANPEASVSSV